VKLQRSKTREVKGKAYYKFTLNQPSAVIDALGWEEGAELMAEAKNGRLVVSRVTVAHGKA
jgi:hypothetical protein